MNRPLRSVDVQGGSDREDKVVSPFFCVVPFFVLSPFGQHSVVLNHAASCCLGVTLWCLRDHSQQIKVYALVRLHLELHIQIWGPSTPLFLC